MLRTTMTLMVSLLLVAACEEERPASPPQASAAASGAQRPAADCEKQATELGRWLSRAAEEGPGPPKAVATLGVKLVKSDNGKRWPWFGSALVLTRQKLQLDLDEAVASDDAAAKKRLETALSQRVQSAVAAGMAPRLDLFVDSEASWKDVVWATQAAARAGFRNQGFAFAGSTKVTDPPPEKLVAKLAEAQPQTEPDPADTPPPLVQEQAGMPAARMLAGCAGATPLLEALGDDSLSLREKVERYSKRMPQTFRTCGCKPGVDEVKAVAWKWLGRSHGPPVVTLEARLAAPKDPEAVTVTAKSDASWQDAHGKLLSAAKGEGALSLKAE